MRLHMVPVMLQHLEQWLMLSARQPHIKLDLSECGQCHTESNAGCSLLMQSNCPVTLFGSALYSTPLSSPWQGIRIGTGIFNLISLLLCGHAACNANHLVWWNAGVKRCVQLMTLVQGWPTPRISKGIGSMCGDWIGGWLGDAPK